MRYIVMAYGQKGYQEFMLPETDNVNYSMSLNRGQFGLSENMSVFMERMDGNWCFLESRDYDIRNYDGEIAVKKSLEDGMVLKLTNAMKINITLVILVISKRVPYYKKYSISHTNHISIGKEDGNTIQYDFRGFISRNHAVIYRSNGQWVVQDNSSNGTYLNGEIVQERQYLKFGDQITLFGLRIIFLVEMIAICSLSGSYVISSNELEEIEQSVQVVSQGTKEVRNKQFFKRSPRIIEALYTEKISIEAPPPLNKAPQRPLLLTIGPSLTMAIPMLLGCFMSIMSAKSRGGTGGLYMFTGVVTAVSSAIIGVIWALTNIRYNSKTEEDNEELRYNSYGQYLLDVTNVIKDKSEYNRNVLFRRYLSGRESCDFAMDDVRLWNHNDHQDDFMVVRLGTATLPFSAEIDVPKEKFALIKDDLVQKPEMIRKQYEKMQAVPFCIDIRKKNLIGIIGGVGKSGAYGIAYNIIAQIAANNCYTDVKMVFIYRDSEENNRRWNFARFLPHVWMDDKKTRLIAGDKSEVGDIFYEIAAVIRMRMEDQEQKAAYPLPHFVFFIDSMELIEGELLENYIYQPQDDYGITSFLLVDRYEDLPNSCENIIQNDGHYTQFFHVFDQEDRSTDLVVETVSETQLEQFAIRICDVEVSEVSGTGEIPTSLDFFDMYGVQNLEELQVLERWKKNRNYENMRVPIGQKRGGSACFLDIHEKYHGPHGLVAGTTGSGKSETLQTYMLSLAVNFSPDDIAFFIIDFKGGGMANLFSGLPHMAGQISNLSGNQVRRAMISIKSENQRRQRMFAEYGVNNINLYTRLFKNHEAQTPIPHLFIIIDEFAELKREEPEFMKELISVAQVGRSLGVHLILATQKPSGTVDDNIWSNSKFRLCLRVQDKQDSNDMLHKPDAAYITQAGRGFLQVGNDEIFEQFQSGFSGAAYTDNQEKNRSAAAVMLTRTGKQTVAGSTLRKKKSEKVKEVTQLDAIIDYLADMAEHYQYKNRMLLWLPVLPEEIFLKELSGWEEGKYCENRWTAHEGSWQLDAEVGLYDDPVNQAQEPFVVSFSEGGHLAVCGTVATGKSTFLQTLLFSLICHYDPEELNFYVLDYSSRMLLPYENAPHCGGVILDTDAEKADKFFYMVTRIMEERKGLFRGGNYSQYASANNKKSAEEKKTLPAILIVIDNYANFREKTSNKYDEVMLRISREGVGYGIFIVASSAGIGTNEIPSRIADNIRTMISLEMGDKFKYAEVLRVTRVEIQPEEDVKGRGLAYVHGNILEFQTALAMEAEDSYQLAEKIEALCKEMGQNWKGRKASPIPVIPEKPVFAEFCQLDEYGKAVQDMRYLPLGYNSVDASVYSVDLWNTYCFMIQGRSRTGKKNVLKELMYAAAQKENGSVCVIDSANGGLKQFAEDLHAQYIYEPQDVYEFFKGTVPVFKERNTKKRELVQQGFETTEIAKHMSREKAIFIFIADLAAFMKLVYQGMGTIGNISAYLENIFEKGSSHGFYVFGCVNPETSGDVAGYSMYKYMTSYRTGIHLGGNIGGQRIFQFANIPFQQQSRTTKPGQGYVPNAEDNSIAETVILPLVKGVIG